MGKFRRVLPYFLRYRWRIAAGLLLSAIVAVVELSIPLLLKDALDRLSSDGDYLGLPPSPRDVIAGIVLTVLALAALSALMRFGQRWLVVGASRSAERDLKNALFEKFTTLDANFFHQRRSGDLLSRATADVEAVRMFLGPGVMYLTKPIVAIPIAIVIMNQVAPVWVFGTVALPLGLLVVLMRVLSPRIERHSAAVQEGISAISDKAQQNFSGVRIIKAFHREEQEAREFRGLCEQYRDRNLDLARVRGKLTAVLATSKDLAAMLVLAVGGLAMLRANFSFGDYFLFVSYIALLYWPLIAIGWVLMMYHRARAAAARLDEIFDSQPLLSWPVESREPGEKRGAIRFEGLSFAYPDGTTALTDIDIEVPAGATLGIVGKTGAGKSTLLHLLGRLYPIDRGRILLDGIDISEWGRPALRRHIAFVPQDSFLFADTIEANLAFGLETMPEREELVRVADRARIAGEVERFPRGYETLVGERGITLSGGQKQRACIARALLVDPRVLVFDDSLSAVDTSTEAELLRNLRDAARGRTTLIVAHRISSVMDADQIIVLERGQIRERGTHEELLARGGWYARTWTRQRLEGELEQL